jgi:hypothetical protein
MAQDDRRAVRGDFDNVVGGVRMRLGKISNDNFVDSLTLALTLIVWSGRPRPLGSWIHGKTLAGGSPATTRFHQFSQHRAPRLKIMLQAQHGQSNAARFWSSKTDDADAAATRRGGDGDDGVVEVHREIVAGAPQAMMAGSSDT